MSRNRGGLLTRISDVAGPAPSGLPTRTSGIADPVIEVQHGNHGHILAGNRGCLLTGTSGNAGPTSNSLPTRTGGVAGPVIRPQERPACHARVHNQKVTESQATDNMPGLLPSTPQNREVRILGREVQN